MTHYPTSKDLSDMRRDCALADPKAGWHAMAKVYIANGRAWDAGISGRASADDRAYGIGGSTIGNRQRFRDVRVAIRSGECFPD